MKTKRRDREPEAVRLMKLRARTLLAENRDMRLAAALEHAAREAGFTDWNRARASSLRETITRKEEPRVTWIVGTTGSGRSNAAVSLAADHASHDIMWIAS